MIINLFTEESSLQMSPSSKAPDFMWTDSKLTACQSLHAQVFRKEGSETKDLFLVLPPNDAEHVVRELSL